MAPAGASARHGRSPGGRVRHMKCASGARPGGGPGVHAGADDPRHRRARQNCEPATPGRFAAAPPVTNVDAARMWTEDLPERLGAYCLERGVRLRARPDLVTATAAVPWAAVGSCVRVWPWRFHVRRAARRRSEGTLSGKGNG